MSFSFVQMLLALLFTYVSYTTQDLERGNLAIESVRQVETRLNRKETQFSVIVFGKTLNERHIVSV